MKFPVRSSIAAGVIALFLLIAGGAWLISFYIDKEQQRDLLQWESRLGLVADGKADAISRLLADDRRDLAELAGNASLQLYLWQVAEARRAGTDTGDTAQQAYLHNLLLAAADRYGYAADASPRIPANVPRLWASGLALLDADLKPVAVTPGLAAAGTVYGDVARRALATPTERVSELLLDPEDRAVLVHAVAVGAVLGARAAGKATPVGVLVAVRRAEQSLFPLLTRGPSFAEDSETLLLARRDDSVIYLSPTRDGSGPLRRSLPVTNPQLAEAEAARLPGGFVALANYKGTPVLQVSRVIRGQPWILAQQVDAAQALSEANARRSFLLTVLSLLLVSIVAFAVAAWRHGSSVRARQHAEELQDKATRLQRQTDLLHTVTDNIDVMTVLMNREQEVLFTNQATATAAQNTIAGIVGGRLGAIFGPATAAELAQVSDEVRRRRAPVHRILRLQLGETTRSFNTSLIPVERIGERRQLVLLVLSDVTELQLAEQRHEEFLRNLVSTLSHAVDLHDPFSANHATRMAEVAQAVARELGLADAERETLDLAATLANIGKIMIPSDLLTKTAPLTAADRELLHKHVDYSLELLKGLDFEGPVLDVIAQKQERLDGSGYPRGLTAQQMSISGRILAVANAFVALVSVRAYRQGVSVPDALEELMQGAGTQYDRKVIAALFHVVENRRDWSEWK